MQSPKRQSENERTYKDLSPSQFRENATRAIQWISDYFGTIDQYPVLSRIRPGEIKSRLPSSPPGQPESFEKILSDFENIIVPGITHWNHPRFMAYFSITGSGPGIIGEMLSGALNVNAMLWKTSPAATELEDVVLDWLRQMVGLPATFEGIINDTASVSSLCAMAAAREAAGLDIREKGLAGRDDLPRLRFYTSIEAHSSIEKAAIVLGLGQQGLQKIPTDNAFRMDADVLRQRVEADLEQGIKPIGVIATLGTTSTTSIDPINEIAAICEKHALWLHVDAAYAGAAAILPEIRTRFSGWKKADSIVINPHKWLFTPIDCSVLYCRKSEILKGAFSLVPEYLRTSEGDEVKNYMDYGVALGRRFRALKLWMIIRTLGISGITDAIREHISFADRLKKLILQNPDFELLAPVPFSTLVFRFTPGTMSNIAEPQNVEASLEKLNAMLLERINQTGKVFLSHTKLAGKFGIRIAIGNLKTRWDDIELVWEIVQQQARELTLVNQASAN
ncbi:amino acid decarboxylase [candidate division KSB1 bacterium]|nr:amino acid decarboxylase [candidate division KSB1 bacterium]